MPAPCTMMSFNEERSILILGDGQLARRLRHVMLGAVAARRTDCKDFDITSTKFLDAISKFEPKLVINTAAFTDVDAAEDDYMGAFEVNSLAVERIAKYCEYVDIPFITFSTDYVFGSCAGYVTEDSKPAPVNNYGRSKLDGERRVLGLGMTVPHYIIRTSNLYDCPDWRRNNLTFKLIKSMLTLDKFDVFVDAYVNPTNAVDLAVAVTNLAARLLRKQKVPEYGILHMASLGNSLSVAGLATILSSLYTCAGFTKLAELRRVPYDAYGVKVQRPVNVHLYDTKLSMFPDLTLPTARVGLHRSFMRDNWFVRFDNETQEILTGVSAV